MTLDRLVFENPFLSLFVDSIDRAKASVRPHIFDVVIISVVVKWGVFEVIGRGRTNKCMVLCDFYHVNLTFMAIPTARQRPAVNPIKRES